MNSTGPLQWHALPLSEVLSLLVADKKHGLSESEAKARLARIGRNRLREVRGRSLWTILASQFQNLPTILLFVAGAISFIVARVIEGIAIVGVVFLTILLGFFTEQRAQEALEGLKQLSVPFAKVRRNGGLRRLPADELVPGDIIELEAGDRVPADARLIEAAGLLVEEAALTGESIGVDKDPSVIVQATAPIGERLNSVYLGSTVLEGRAKAVIVSTGMKTEAGRIGTLVEQAGEELTPLEKRLAQLGSYLIVAVLVLIIIYVAIGIVRGEVLDRLILTGIVLAVAAVPEGLPAVATITLALGVRRMASHNALIRRLPAVETLGSVTVVCTDKTGTLTLNQMTVQEIIVASRKVRVTGEGYMSGGQFIGDGKLIQPQSDEALMRLLQAASLCNDAELEERIDGSKVSWTVVGDPTEGALLVAVKKAGLDPGDFDARYPKLDEIPFDPKLKKMTTIHRSSAGDTVAFTKGALEVILPDSKRVFYADGVRKIESADREQFLRSNHEMANRGLRVLALAMRNLPDTYSMEHAQKDLTIIGLVGIFDPTRPGTKQAISLCKEAGIRVVMLTGDQLPTALAVARELSLTEGGLGAMDDVALTKLSPTQLSEETPKLAVFARVSPEHKLTIIRAFQQAGAVVAMTGDGINDAPALKSADIGIAMGQRGTDVAREVADMVLADDNFATIAVAVEQGRVIYANIAKFVQYLLSCNLSEIFTMLFAVALGLPFPLLPLQILWLNLTVNTFPALALATEPMEQDVMRLPPRHPRESLLPASSQARIIGLSLLLTLATLVAFIWALSVYGEGQHSETIAFVTLGMAQLWLAFSARSNSATILTLGPTSNLYLVGAVAVTGLSIIAAVYVPGLNDILENVVLGPSDWIVGFVCSLAPFLVIEVWKWWRAHLQ